jgi:hypothetical protein
MQLADKYRDAWIKFPLASPALPAFAEGAKGRLYVLVPNPRPGAMDASVWRVDRDGVVFRLEGPAVAARPLASIPPEQQFALSGGWIWTWDAPATTAR